MPIVIVSDHAYKSVQANAIIKFDEDLAKQRPNGEWEVSLSQDLIERMKPSMLSHESISEAIERWHSLSAAAYKQRADGT